ncbi:amidohydrolase family protein [Paracoccus aestuariivivens]|uniref:Amidohydrolase family protein n=1 Tax=Paracoccus aestuariivivens TaxID=1820333 RepID=A0A6L6JDU2_9RHOB|nr:amidohydrolase family protein [Paracoccus aestuariivivens]MTH78081.1 amidohydrolase family protein [Paracoccus aestuariivivens]
MGHKKIDLLLRNARLTDSAAPTDLAIADGRFVAIASGQVEVVRRIDLQGRVVIPGLVETHIHLDKARLSCRCAHGGSLQDAVAAVALMKRGFTRQDVYDRAAKVVEAAILQGTMHLRSHVEVDPRAGLRSLEAILLLREDYRFAMDITICAFAQEGLTNDPGTEELLHQALERGADLLGGCPYTDSDPVEQIWRLFDMAVAHDVDLDFHLDFDLDPSWSHMDAICDNTQRTGWHGRVNIGHVTKLAAMDDAEIRRYAKLLAAAGVAVTALPSTDLYLNSGNQGFRASRGIAPVHLLAKHGVEVSVASNNIMNPFTPYGDCSLLRIANLYANAMGIGPDGFADCFDMIGRNAARIMRLPDYGLKIGDRADLIVLDTTSHAEAFATIAQPVMGFKAGRQSFSRPEARILREKTSIGIAHR